MNFIIEKSWQKIDDINLDKIVEYVKRQIENGDLSTSYIIIRNKKFCPYFLSKMKKKSGVADGYLWETEYCKCDNDIKEATLKILVDSVQGELYSVQSKQHKKENLETDNDLINIFRKLTDELK